MLLQYCGSTPVDENLINLSVVDAQYPVCDRSLPDAHTYHTAAATNCNVAPYLPLICSHTLEAQCKSHFTRMLLQPLTVISSSFSLFQMSVMKQDSIKRL